MIYIYIIIMAIVTYLIRMLPLTIFQQKIQNRWIRSFLYYVPYVCLASMTVPAIFTATESGISAVAGFAIAIILSMKEKGLMVVAAGSCLSVFLVEQMIALL